jgi:ribulose-5-phosphate 4-epimerase/fuculose-1-phosphate aldolase
METDDIARQRIDLAAAFRWAARLGFHEGVCNHFSVAVSPSGDRFLVNPHGRHFSEIRASDLLLVEPDGSVAGDGEPPEPTAFFIHSRLHCGLPHARCILHTHMPYATALTTLEGGRLEPVNQNALRFYDQIAYDDEYNGLALDEAEGDRMCAALGNRQIMFMANHGVSVIGHSVAFAFDSMYYLERACRNQVLAMSTGRPLKRVPDALARKVAQQIAGEDNSKRHFDALKRILDREEPDYAA